MKKFNTINIYMVSKEVRKSSCMTEYDPNDKLHCQKTFWHSSQVLSDVARCVEITNYVCFKQNIFS
jgi:hypothetical protein